MAYFELNPNGATGVSNSSPITLATDHIYPLPISTTPAGAISGNVVSGSTGIMTTSTVTIIPAPAAGKFLYVTSISVMNTTAVNTIHTVFSNGFINHIAACSTPNNGLSILNFPTPLKLSAATALTATQNGGVIAAAASPGVYVTATGFVAGT